MEPSSIASLIDESLASERGGDISAALQKAQEALKEARRLDEPGVVAQALACLAKVHFHLGRYQAAQELAEEALALTPPNAPARIEALLRLGACSAETSSLVEAEGHYWHAANLAREFGYPLLRFRALHNLAAGVYVPRGQFDLALAADEEAHRIASEQNFSEWLAYPSIIIAWVCLLTGRRRRARAALDELAHEVLPGSAYQGYSICLAGHLALDEGDSEGASALYTQARSIAEVTGEPWINIMLRVGMSRYHRTIGDGPAARVWADDALSFATRVGYRHAQGNALIERGCAIWLCGDLSAAETDLVAAIDILTPLGTAFDLARAWLLLAALRFARRAPLPELHAAWLEAVSRIVSGGYAFLLEQERALTFPLLASLLDSDDSNVVTVSKTLLGHLARVPPPPLRIVTLGRFEIQQRQRLVEKRALRQRRAGDLLALLLLAPRRTLSFDQVAEALCPERDPSAAQTFFHHATSSLRRALEPDLPEKFPSRYLEVEEGQVTLHLPPDSWVDFETFEAHCRQGEWEAALALYGGELLPEYLYADWAIAPRQRLAFLYQQALLAVAKDRLAEGRFAEVLDACHRALALEPWQEQAVLVGMQACVGLNDRAGALRLYKNLEKTLRQDLDTTPSDELQALYRSLAR
jgi:DNA-binding SARP family transcriptional activator